MSPSILEEQFITYIFEPCPLILVVFPSGRVINSNCYVNSQFDTLLAYCSRFGNASNMGSTSSASRPEDMKVDFY